jgi:hypothetical protein
MLTRFLFHSTHSAFSLRANIEAGTATVGGGPFCFDHEFRGIHTAKVGLNYHLGVSAY